MQDLDNYMITDEIENILGYTFDDKSLLKHALTHSSFTPDFRVNYERLEFLGDRILGVSIAKMVYEKFPDEPEGNLSQRLMALVCKDAVSEVVKKLGLSDYIIIANDDAKDSINVLCDVGEAIIAAICLDSSIDEASAFVRRNWEDLVEKYRVPPKDPKTTLQEIAYKVKLGNPHYEIIAKSGCDHLPVFTAEVSIEGGHKATGKGTNKKLAEQAAARQLLVDMGYQNGQL